MHSPAPQPTYRLIPSRFPPIGLFDTVATAADLEAVMELAGWTNDRLLAERLQRLPREEWVFGRPNSSIVMATFLHVNRRRLETTVDESEAAMFLIAGGEMSLKEFTTWVRERIQVPESRPS